MGILTWPQAFALVFGGLPAFALGLAVLATEPLVGWPLLALAMTGYLVHRRARTHAELAARADASLAAYAALTGVGSGAAPPGDARLSAAGCVRTVPLGLDAQSWSR